MGNKKDDEKTHFGLQVFFVNITANFKFHFSIPHLVFVLNIKLKKDTLGGVFLDIRYLPTHTVFVAEGQVFFALYKDTKNSSTPGKSIMKYRRTRRLQLKKN